MLVDMLCLIYVVGLGQDNICIIIFNNQGQILLLDRDSEGMVEDLLLCGKFLILLLLCSEMMFLDYVNLGEKWVFSVVLVVLGLVYVLGLWNCLEFGIVGIDLMWCMVLFLLLVLWVVLLVVVYFVVYCFVLCYIWELCGQMCCFVIGDCIVLLLVLVDVFVEIVDMSQIFYNMVCILICDEEVMEVVVNEKIVLLKEVYYWVKNNL